MYVIYIYIYIYKFICIYSGTVCIEEAKKMKKSKKKSDKPDTFTEKLITNLLKNMEVKIRDIHVRYEDSTQLQGHGTLAAGVTLHSLELKASGVCVCVCVGGDEVAVVTVC